MRITRDSSLWQPTYAAYFALQVRDRMQDGRGSPDPAPTQRFAEEAAAVADMLITDVSLEDPTP